MGGRRYFQPEDLPLLGQLEAPLDDARRQALDGALRRAAAAADGSAAPVEYRHRHAVLLGHLGQRALRAVERERRREDAGVLVRIGVADHDLLPPAAQREVARVLGVGEGAVDLARAALEIVEGLEEGHDRHRRHALVRPTEPGGSREHQRGQHVLVTARHAQDERLGARPSVVRRCMRRRWPPWRACPWPVRGRSAAAPTRAPRPTGTRTSSLARWKPKTSHLPHQRPHVRPGPRGVLRGPPATARRRRDPPAAPGRWRSRRAASVSVPPLDRETHQRLARRLQPRFDPAQLSPVGLVARTGLEGVGALRMRRAVARQGIEELLAHPRPPRALREARAQASHFAHVERHRVRRQRQRRVDGHLGGHVGIAVHVGADPRAEAEDRRHPHRRAVAPWPAPLRDARRCGGRAGRGSPPGRRARSSPRRRRAGARGGSRRSARGASPARAGRCEWRAPRTGWPARDRAAPAGRRWRGACRAPCAAAPRWGAR